MAVDLGEWDGLGGFYDWVFGMNPVLARRIHVVTLVENGAFQNAWGYLDAQHFDAARSKHIVRHHLETALRRYYQLQTALNNNQPAPNVAQNRRLDAWLAALGDDRNYRGFMVLWPRTSRRLMQVRNVRRNNGWRW